MPRFFGYRRRFYGGYRRRFYRGYGRRWRRGFYRRGWSKNGSSNSRVNITVPVTCQMQVTMSALNQGIARSNVASICPWLEALPATTTAWANPIQMRGSAFSSALYQAYSGLYDEVKCNSMSVIVNVLDQKNDITVITAFDRKFSVVDYTTEFPNGDQLATNGSAQRRTFVNNQVPKAYRTCFATDLNEKINFTDVDQNPNYAITGAGNVSHGHRILKSGGR